MTRSSAKPTILIIGNDERLAYLLNRYAEQGDLQISALRPALTAPDIENLYPDAVIFTALDHLQAAEHLIENLSTHEIMVLVCASVADELRARELGADACLYHPLTYGNFIAALSTIVPP